MSLKRYSNDALKKLGFNTSKDFMMLPEGIMNNRERSVFESNRLKGLTEWRKNNVVINAQPPLPGYENVVFAHGLAAVAGNENNSALEGLKNLDNIMNNKIGSHMAISVSKPGEEIGKYGVYVTGNVHQNGNKDIESFMRGDPDLFFKTNPEIPYDDYKAIKSVGKNRTENIVESGLDSKYFDRMGSREAYLKNLKENADPKTFFNMETPGITFPKRLTYTESILSDPKIQSLWYFPSEVSTEERNMLTNYAKEHNLELIPKTGTDFGAQYIDPLNQVKERRGRDRFNTHLYDWDKSEIDALQSEANFINNIRDIDPENYEKYLSRVNKTEGNTHLERERNYLKQYPSADEIANKYKDLGMQDKQSLAVNLMEKYNAGELTQEEVRSALGSNDKLIESYQKEVQQAYGSKPEDKALGRIREQRREANVQELAQEHAQSIIARRPEPTDMHSITEEAIARGTAQRRIMRQEAAQESANNILSRYDEIKANNAINKNEIVQDAIERGRAKRIESVGAERVHLEDVARSNGVSLRGLERAGHIDFSGDIPSFSLNEDIAAGLDDMQEINEINLKEARRARDRAGTDHVSSPNIANPKTTLRERISNRANAIKERFGKKKANLPSQELLEQSKKDITTDTSVPIPEYKDPVEELGPRPQSNREKQKQINQEQQSTRKKGETKRERKQRIKENKERRQSKLEQNQQRKQAEQAKVKEVKSSPYYANDKAIEDTTVGEKKLRKALSGNDKTIVTGSNIPEVMSNKKAKPIDPRSNKKIENPYRTMNKDIWDPKTGERKLDEALNGKHIVKTGSDNPEIMNRKDLKGKTHRIEKMTNDDGTITGLIHLNDKDSVSVTFNKDKVIKSKSYTRDLKSGDTVSYIVNFGKDGKVTSEGFNQNGKWANRVYYDSDLNPHTILTDKDFTPEAGRKMKDKADAAFKEAGFSGINDVIPDFHYDLPKPEPNPEPEVKFNPDEVDPNIHFNQQDYSKYQMNDEVARQYNGKPNAYEKRMAQYDDIINEYEEMSKLSQESSIVRIDGKENYEKNKEALEKYFGKDYYSRKEKELAYKEAKLYGREADKEGSEIARNSKKWWDDRDDLLKEQRKFKKEKGDHLNKIKANKELADSNFLHEYAANKDIVDLRRTKGDDYINNNPQIKKAVEDAEAWLGDDINTGRYESIPKEFRDKVEGDIKKKRFELNKRKRNVKLDADHANFKSKYDDLSVLQKDETDKLRQLESNYRSWQRTQGRKGRKGGSRPSILDDIDKQKEKIKQIKAERRKVKKDMKRTDVKTRDRASNIKEEIRNIKNTIDDNTIYEAIQQQYANELKNNPSLTFEQYLKDNYGGTHFENFKPKTKPELENLKDELQFHTDLLKEQSGIDISKEEGDVVEKLWGKFKGADKINLALSGINAIGQYKDSRKEGRGVLSSVTRSGVDFAASQLMGAKLYIALGLVKAAPKAAVTGGLALQNQVRQMNTASRFRVFGDANFQDNDKLATMRQSGMEMAKMANYNLEQTLMGNEARYLHR